MTRPGSMSRSAAKRLTSGVAAALALAAAAVAQPPPSSPEDFANAAAQSDQYEIQSGRLVDIDGQDAQVKAFARQMIVDHGKTTASLVAAARASRLPPPAQILSDDQRRMLSALQSLKGAALDHAYLVQQVNAHTAALVTNQDYAGKGSDPNLRRVAQAAIPVVQQRLQMAKQMSASSPP